LLLAAYHLLSAACCLQPVAYYIPSAVLDGANVKTVTSASPTDVHFLKCSVALVQLIKPVEKKKFVRAAIRIVL
jgi:hypothetical protein